METVVIRNVDEVAFTKLKAWAAANKMNIGPAISVIINKFFVKEAKVKNADLTKFGSFDFGPGSINSSQEIDDYQGP